MKIEYVEGDAATGLYSWFGPAMEGDAGTDLRATSGHLVYPLSKHTFGTGISVAIPKGYVGLVFPRSGLACRGDLTLANSVGVIDSGYRGEIKATLYNMDPVKSHMVNAGDRIAQLVIIQFAEPEYVEADHLDETERGDGGYGSTGVE